MNEVLKLYGTIGSMEADAVKFADNISELERKGSKNLTIHMHSPGGSVFDGNLIFNTILNSKMHIKIVIDGIAASMAGIILLAANEVEIAENGFVMVHSPSISLDGTVNDLKVSAKILEDMEIDFARNYARKTGRSEREFKDTFLDGKDHWLNADEAVNFGFADRKISSIAKDVKTLDKKVLSRLGVENMYSRYAASLNIKNKTRMKKELIQILKLDGVTESSTDDEIIAKIKERVAELEKTNKTETEASVTALIETERGKGKTIPQTMFDTYKAIGMTMGVAELIKILDQIPQPVNILNQIRQESKDGVLLSIDRSKWTLDDYRRNDLKALERDPQLFKSLYEKEFKTRK